jgi:hypothetical protein
LDGKVVNPKVKRHDGRLVKNTGDGGLVEFSRDLLDADVRAHNRLA